MTRRNAPEMILVHDPLPVMLDEHTDEAGLCVICTVARPCELVVVPTHNLAVI